MRVVPSWIVRKMSPKRLTTGHSMNWINRCPWDRVHRSQSDWQSAVYHLRAALQRSGCSVCISQSGLCEEWVNGATRLVGATREIEV